MLSTKQSTGAGEAGARGARVRLPAVSGCDAEIVHVTIHGRPAMGTLASARVWPTTCAQNTSVSNTVNG